MTAPRAELCFCLVASVNQAHFPHPSPLPWLTLARRRAQAKVQQTQAVVEVRAEPMAGMPQALQGIPMDRLAFSAIVTVGALGYGIYKLATRPKMPRPAPSAVRSAAWQGLTHLNGVNTHLAGVNTHPHASPLMY